MVHSSATIFHRLNPYSFTGHTRQLASDGRGKAHPVGASSTPRSAASPAARRWTWDSHDAKKCCAWLPTGQSRRAPATAANDQRFRSLTPPITASDHGGRPSRQSQCAADAARRLPRVKIRMAPVSMPKRVYFDGRTHFSNTTESGQPIMHDGGTTLFSVSYFDCRQAAPAASVTTRWVHSPWHCLDFERPMRREPPSAGFSCPSTTLSLLRRRGETKQSCSGAFLLLFIHGD